MKTTNRYVAFLRGINVGGRIIKMTDLKACFESIGFTAVQTLLQTGNVLFGASENNIDTIRQEIEEELTRTFNYPAKVLVYSVPSVAKIVDTYPFDVSDKNYHNYIIFFLDKDLANQLAGEGEQLDLESESVAAGEGVVYWRVEKGRTLKSSFAQYLTKSKYKEFHTNRNINTIKKIIGL